MPALEGAQGRSVGLFLVYCFWVLKVWEVEQFLSVKAGGPFFRLPTLLAPFVLAAVLARARKDIIYWPLIIFTLLHLGAGVLAENAGLARIGAKYMVYMVLLFAASVAYIDSPRRAQFILKLFLLSFVWFGLQGLPSGLVAWNILLGNEDSFGPLMVLGIPFAYFFSFAAASTRWRWCARATFVICLLGLVASFARGAAVSAGAVLAFMILRSPQKSKALGYVLLAAVVSLPVLAALVPMDAYVSEISTSGQGDPVRWNLWHLAWEVFKTSPVVGVGSGNYGVIADQIASPEARELVWGGLYFRTTHNPTLQILAEEGVVGIATWMIMIVSFFRWNAKLRGLDSRTTWRQAGGSDLDLGMVSLGLDGAMLGFLLTSVFYNQLYISWFWVLLTISFVLKQIASNPMHQASKGPRRADVVAARGSYG